MHGTRWFTREGGQCGGGEGSAYALPTLVPAAAPPQLSRAKCTCVVGSGCRCTRTRLIRVLVQTGRRSSACVCSRGVRVHVQLPERGEVVHVDAQLRGGDAVCTEERRPASRLGVETAGSAAVNTAPVAAAQLLRESCRSCSPRSCPPPSRAVNRPEPTLTARGGVAWRGWLGWRG